MRILMRRSANWGSAMGVLISHLPARNPLGKDKILSKDGCLGWEPPGTFWEQNIKFFLAAWERETFSILSEYTGRSLQHTLTFTSGFFHPSERKVLSHSYSISKSYSVSTTAALPRKKRWKARAWATLRFQVSYPSRRWKKKPRERGGERAQHTVWWIPCQSLRAFYLRCPHPVVRLGPGVPLKWLTSL